MSDQKQCATCRYWRRPVDPNNKGLCINIRNSGWHRSERAEIRPWEPPLILKLLVRRWTLELRTEPDFGCSEWKEQR